MVERKGGKEVDHKGNTNFDWNQDLDKFNIYFLRYSEIGLKGEKTRNQMEINVEMESL